MNRRAVMQDLGFIALAAVSGFGCGGGPRTMGPEEDLSPDRTPVQEIGAMYQMFVKENNRPPKSLADFEKYAPGMAYGYDSLKRGEQEVLWGSPIESTESAARTILAYQKQAPTQGGYVLMKDASTVQKLTAGEFQSAPKAK